MELIEMIGFSAFIIFLYMTFMFLLAIIVKDNSIADTAWGIGFIVVSLSTLLIGGEFAPRQMLVAALVLVWGLGFFFESVGDYQLDRFIGVPENQGGIIDRGLWRYTRHPNYFGEVTMWWGIFILALAVPWGWIGIIGPMVITLMIVLVSGIPLTERHMEKNPDFAEYKRKTSVLIPWFPRR
jgi:steroid 5-alpha reductase family enzyme